LKWECAASVEELERQLEKRRQDEKTIKTLAKVA